MLRFLHLWLLLVLLVAEPVCANEGGVASGHPLATDAGIAVLKSGGNAFDAAVAVSLVIGVVEPEGSGIGGGGFAVLYDVKRKQSRALDFREVAPLKASADRYRDAKGQALLERAQDGILAGGVPGQVRGLARLHRAYGRLPFSRVVAPALRLAQEGFPVSERLHRQLADQKERLSRQSAAARIWYPKGLVPPTGSILKQPDLALTLKAIAQSGGESFYTGSTARLWVQYMQKAGGLVSAYDLKTYQPVWREPLVGYYRDLTVVSMPPPSSGGVHLIEMLNVLSLRDLKAMAPLDRTLFMAEAMKRAYADRSRFLGDPAFVPVPVAALTSLAYARRLERTIQAVPVPSTEVVPGAMLDQEIRTRFSAWEQTQTRQESLDTSHLTVIDGEGNAIALTQTINGSFGAGVVVPGTGVLLNNEMDDFSLAPGIPNQFGLVGAQANAILPNKRPLSSMTPTLVFKAGKPWLGLGSPGGGFIITAVLQTLVNVVDLGQPLDAAVASPRFHHQWQPDRLFVEPGLPASLTADLSAKGYSLRPTAIMGSIQAVMYQPLQTPRFIVAADPRREGSARIWLAPPVSPPKVQPAQRPKGKAGSKIKTRPKRQR
ncbi:gamma-glutamyltransferase [Anthocerotibacter panamensis]|uniref:gamma-glutamyltransferase n=1 Tax=Anthocerotibacter panamensis TaxID=2857077 RepID=UPI001C4075CF|nr:gamma-glutamyltransferase [Anthocerotibacter panamensis]